MIATSSSDVIRFRTAVLADVESFRELRLEALRNHPTAFGQDYVEAAKRNQEYWIKTLTINEESEALFFAEYNSQLIGMTGIFRGLSIKGRHSATVWGVYVKPEWRGRHIAEALLRSCLAWAKDHHVAIVKLGVVTTNKPAIRVYERCGFSTYGIEPKAIYYDNIFYDECLMAVHL
jgi:RimJ/RimL family protein N-acetyltransferase